MTENEKRWLVTGIAFQKILFPQIRLHVEQRMRQTFGPERYVELSKRRAGSRYENVRSFDEFDIPAILKLLSDHLHCLGAQDFRDARSTWVDTDSNKWDKTELETSFRAMRNLVIGMHLPNKDEQKLLESLEYLEEKGILRD